jgi:hypothetical protein
MGNSRIWLFRGLVIIAIGLLLVSWFLPWWSAQIAAINVTDPIVIHPWGLEMNMAGMEYLMPTNAEMPGWFAPIMWLYLGLAIAALLIGAWIKDKSICLLGRKLNLSRWLIGIVGFSYIIVVIAAVIVAAIRTGDFGINLLGKTFVSMSHFAASNVYSSLLFGYWLACAVGPLLILLALLRNKIVGKDKLT